MNKENNEKIWHDRIQTVCAVISVVLAAIALAVSFMAIDISKTANSLAQLAYDHSTVSYNPILDIKKENNFITILNEDMDNFDVYEVTIDGVEKYTYNSRDLEFNMFHYNHKKGDGNIDLNDIKVDTTEGFQTKHKNLTSERTQQFKEDVDAWIEILKNDGFYISNKQNIYYISISYTHRYDYESKTICLECSVGENGEFYSIIPYSDKGDICSYREKDGYFSLIHSEHNFGLIWNKVTDWIKNVKID